MFALTSAVGARLLGKAVDAGDAFLARKALAVMSQTSPSNRSVIQGILSGANTSVGNLQVVARVLASYGQIEAVACLLQHESGDIRLDVGRLIARWGDRADIEKLERTLALEADPYILAEVQRSLDKSRSGAITQEKERLALDSLTEQDLFVIRLLCEPLITWRDAPALAGLLEHESPTARTMARSQLSNLGRPGALAVAAVLDVDQLRGSLADTWKLLFEVDEAMALQRLRARLQHGKSLPHCVANELLRIGDGSAVAMLAASLALQIPGEHDWHRRAIEKLKSTALEPLSKAFREQSGLREHEAELLANIGGTIVIDQLVCGLRDANSIQVQEIYVSVLRRFGRGAAQPLISTYSHSNRDARLALIPAIANAGAPETWSLLHTAATETGDTQAPAIAALGADLNARSKQIVCAASQSPDATQRAAAVNAVMNWGAADALSVLQSLALDPSLEIMHSVFRAFERIAQLGRDDTRLVTKTLLELYPLAQSQELLTAVSVALERFGDVDVLAQESNAIVGISSWKPQIESILTKRKIVESQRDVQRQHQVQKQHQQQQIQNQYEPIVASSGVGNDDIGPMKDTPARYGELVADVITDEVQFSVTAPSMVAKGREFLLDVWVHVAKDHGVVIRCAQKQLGTERIYSRSAGPYPVARGTPLRMLASIPGLEFADEDVLYWSGKVGSTSFLVAVQEQARAGLHTGTIQLFVGPLRIARVHFSVLVGDWATDAEDRTLQQDRVKTAFASYATEDRGRVLARIQGMQKLVPTLEIFLDAISLRSGDDWKLRIEEEIKTRDVLYLFWSEFAMRSQWVDREWRFALCEKGLEFIDPVPLDSPKSAPPPKELSSLHFYEWTLELRSAGFPRNAPP